MGIDHRRVAAEHEAAHVVLYVELGYPIHSSELYDDLTGLTLSRPEPFAIDAVNGAAIRMAGVVVEDRYVYRDLGERLLAANIEDDGGDIAGLSLAMANVGYQIAIRVLELREEFHSALSDALYERGRIDGSDVERIFSTIGGA